LEKFVKELIAKDFIGNSIRKHQIKGLAAIQA
jgi:hypothetical protein